MPDDLVHSDALLVSERQAAAMLAVSVPTMYRLRQAGLPFVKLNSGIRYDPADLARWRDERKQTMAPVLKLATG